MQYIVPDSEPYFLPGGTIGCLLMHGFTAMPEEMRPLGDFLASNGITVYGVRLAGHATHPRDLKRIRWPDWLDNVEDGLALISRVCTRNVLIGQSMGGMIALTAAARYEISAVVALSTPYGSPPGERLIDRMRMLLRPTIRKNVERFPSNHPLHHRRELNYPAYPEFPSRILGELNGLAVGMVAALPQVRVPALLIHSRADHSVPFACLQSKYDKLGSPHKEMLALDGMDHSLVRDPQRQQVFDAILQFVSKLE
jgi:carboxylesterase